MNMPMIAIMARRPFATFAASFAVFAGGSEEVSALEAEVAQ
jgi:hypothetical protein